MKNEKDKLDLLLEQNTNEQLAGVNFEQFNDSILHRLNQVSQQQKKPKVQYRIALKVAAGFVIAAAVATFSILFNSEKTEIKQSSDTPRAVVTFSKIRGSAVVEILDSNGKENNNNNNTEQSSIMIIRKQKSKILSDIISRDELDFACLL